MGINVNAIAIASRQCRNWDRKQTADRYVEYQRLRLLTTGKLETVSMRIVSTKNGDAYIITAVTTIKTTLQKVADHMAEILEFGRMMPLMAANLPHPSSVSYSGNLPDYYDPKREPSMAEKYAERLRADRWDTRKGEPYAVQVTRTIVGGEW